MSNETEIVEIEVCLKPLLNMEEITEEKSMIEERLKESISILLKDRFVTLEQSSEVQIEEIRNFATVYGIVETTNYNKVISPQMISSLCSHPMSLIKAEILISVYIKSIYIGQVFKFNNIPKSFSSILIGLQNGHYKAFDEFEELVGIKNPEYKFKFYHNLDEIGTEKRMISENFINEFDNITLAPISKGKNEMHKFDYILNSLSQNKDNSGILDHLKLTAIPNTRFDKLWTTLRYEKNLKVQILNYSKMLLSLMSSTSIQTYNNNKLLLFHGPPGSGKTTLCKALAQKISIRKNGIFIELSCSKIFSKWLGESSQKLEFIFKELFNLIQSHQEIIIIICIDEVETIANSRSQTLDNKESTDSIRVVNTLLTQLDSLKIFDNFLILTTSNLLKSLDSAYLDRVDESFWVNRPSAAMINCILRDSINNVIGLGYFNSGELLNDSCSELSTILQKTSERCYSLEVSGRYLSKLPLMILSKMSPLVINDNKIEFSVFIDQLVRYIFSKEPAP
ncbi:hypothetical protein WICMUC_001616 [Wickerhamomyces mucosus]|uniref:AAA+ ATPase domain-containing protein n=1 Tax=Wickerhamomyces mucosus TaxID=1378264 RepID=A0A9P8PUB9_9ASCO|nr:hypothetical protein WICMUC_001616 [Wickerhamomyces mucosus]